MFLYSRLFLTVVLGGVLLVGCRRRGKLYEWGSDGTANSYDCRDDKRRCVSAVPAGYDDLSLFIIGTEAEVVGTHCPGFAPDEGLVAHGDLVAPLSCPTCDCGPSSCVLATDFDVSSAPCSSSGSPVLTFDAPLGWDGQCTAQDAVPTGTVCDGVPCVQSLTIPSPLVEPCQPIALGTTVQPEPQWGTMAKECLSGIEAKGCTHARLCAPTVPPEGLLALCLVRYGEDDGFQCHQADYPRRFVVYTDIVDKRSCSSCECQDPEGTFCSALITSYANDSCSDPPVSALWVSTEVPDLCTDLDPGVGLGSKTATLDVQPGSCAPLGGNVTGEIQYAGAMVLCCEDPQGAPK